MLARAISLRGREVVTVKFNEAARSYTVTTASGRELASRRFDGTGDLTLSSVDLALTGDSIAFSGRGVGSLSASVGLARFQAGTVTYQVQFNPMASSKVSRL
jgi:hypothetical protein